MKIGIIGPGALGCLFAAKFVRAGHDIMLADYKPERAKRISENGISVEEGDAVWNVPVYAGCDFRSHFDLLLVLVKAHSTGSLALPPGTTVLSLQNGLNNAETLCAKIGADNLLAGTTSLAVTSLGEGRVRYVAPGVCRFGAWGGADAAPATRVLREAGFEVELVEKPAAAIWQKAAVNAGINPLTALLNVPNGKLLENEEARALLGELVREAADVAGAEGFPLDAPLDLAESVCRATAENISSMLQDVRNGKRTEIGALNGEIVRRGETHGLDVGVNRTVLRLVKVLERR